MREGVAGTRPNSALRPKRAEMFFYRLLLNPSNRIVDLEDREKARLLAILLLTRFMALVCIFAYDMTHFTDRPSESLRPLAAAIGINAVAYLISRTRQYRVGCLLVVAEGIVGITTACLLDDTPRTVATATLWFGLSILICSLTMRVRWGVLATALSCCAFAVIGLHVRAESAPFVAMTFLYFIVSSSLALVGSAMREKKDQLLVAERAKLAQASKLSALGEMSGGIAHEINNPLAIISATASQMSEILAEEPIDRALISEMSATIEETSRRIAKIVQGMRSLSRDGGLDQTESLNLGVLLEDALCLCRERLHSREIALIVEPFDLLPLLRGKRDRDLAGPAESPEQRLRRGCRPPTAMDQDRDERPGGLGRDPGHG